MEVTVDKLKSFHNFFQLRSAAPLKFDKNSWHILIFEHIIELCVKRLFKETPLAYFHWKIAEIPAKGISIVIRMIDSCVMLWKFIFFQQTASSHIRRRHPPRATHMLRAMTMTTTTLAYMHECVRVKNASYLYCIQIVCDEFSYDPADKVMLQLWLLGQHRYHFSSHSA
jgi:hypothetical protein